MSPPQQLAPARLGSVRHDACCWPLVSSRVASQPWVQALSMAADDGQISWHVSVSDEAAAEDLLLRLILEDRNLKVKHFGRKTYNLEEVFLEMVEKENLIKEQVSLYPQASK